jgi:hypothetical protein
MSGTEETILEWRLCHWIRYPFWLSFGTACVTDAAFIWKPAYAASFLTGWLFRGAGMRVSREDLRAAERGTFGLNKNILCLLTNTGRRYRFQVDDVDAWLNALRPAGD